MEVVSVDKSYLEAIFVKILGEVKTGKAAAYYYYVFLLAHMVGGVVVDVM